MKERYRGGGWYIANFERREFAAESFRCIRRAGVRPGEMYITWSAALKYAQIYKSESNAKRRAYEINVQLGGDIPPCTVVTHEAARCLEQIWARERRAEHGTGGYAQAIQRAAGTR